MTQEEHIALPKEIHCEHPDFYRYPYQCHGEGMVTPGHDWEPVEDAPKHDDAQKWDTPCEACGCFWVYGIEINQDNEEALQREVFVCDVCGEDR